MKNTNTILIIIVILLVISNLFFGYMLLRPKSGPDFRGGFDRGGFQQMQLTDEQIQSVTSFFENNPDINQLNEYCDTNRMECFYYCSDVNPNHEFCSQLTQRRPDSQRPDSQQVQSLN